MEHVRPLSDVAVVRLDISDTGWMSAGLNDDRLPALEPAAGEGAGHHGSKARHAEDAVDRQPRPAGLSPLALDD